MPIRAHHRADTPAVRQLRYGSSCSGPEQARFVSNRAHRAARAQQLAAETTALPLISGLAAAMQAALTSWRVAMLSQQSSTRSARATASRSAYPPAAAPADGLHQRVQRLQMALRHFRFAGGGIGAAVQDLPLQVGDVQRVVVGQQQRADPGNDGYSEAGD